MASKLDRKIPALALLAILASAALLWFGTGLHPVWWLTWWAPLPVLWLAARASFLTAFVAAFAGWMLGACNEWTYARQYIQMPVATALLMAAAPAVVFALAVLLWRGFVRRGSLARGALAFAAAWASFEFALQLLSPHSTFGSIAYSQMNDLPILQTASLTGLLGISFLLFLFPSALAAVLSPEGTRRKKRALAGGVMVLLAIAFLGGLWRLRAIPTAVPRVTVGLIASDVPQNLFPKTAAARATLFGQYAAGIRQLAAQGAKIVVLPEKIARIDNREACQLDTVFGDAARSGGVTVVAGLERWTPTVKRNESRIYAPDGHLEALFEKHHMLPPFESYLLPGKTLTVLREPAGKCGITICKDMDFPALSRQYGNRGVGLQLVSAWDFVVDGWLHSRMAIMRGVESGFSLARSAKNGLLTLSDNRGRVLAQTASNSADFATLVTTVPVRNDATLYARWGNWFPWFTVGLLAVLLATLFARDRAR